MLQGELVHKRIAYLSGCVDSNDRRSFVVKREPVNVRDKYAMAVIRQSDGAIVGHIPYNLAPIVSPFLARDYNKAVTEVTSPRVNRGAGYGMEVLCIYRLYGSQRYVDCAVEAILKLLND